MSCAKANEARAYDVVVFGASGFTGRLVAEYFAEHYPVGEPVRWAVAGRHRDKLDGVLAEKCSSGKKPDVLLADSDDGDALAELARSTRVVLTTVGPYAKYGSKLVAACVENGTHYCDLAGEAQWIRRMIDEHQSAAVESGARIVNSCAFDSIPSDIGVNYLQREARARFGKPCSEVILLVKAMKGGASGGTFASMLNVFEEARNDPAVRRILGHPYGLNPKGQQQGPDGSDQHGVRYSEEAGVWTAPFVMAPFNTRIVRRTNALLDYDYGRDFRYREATVTGSGARGWFRAAIVTGGLSGFMLAASSNFLRRKILTRLLPAPGQGPTREQRENGFFDLRIFGKTGNGERIRVRVAGDRDPGYGSTSRMLSESALCLAFDELETGGGFWTPASAMGTQLLDRLTANAGLSFETLP